MIQTLISLSHLLLFTISRWTTLYTRNRKSIENIETLISLSTTTIECNKEEARKAIEIAERKLSENDHNGAKRFVSKAKSLYPNLDGLEQMSTMIEVYASASSDKTNGSESDWYGVLAVDPLADEKTLKKQYKKLALLLHPDKNRFNGAEGAFKLVLHAWSLLSDKAKRVAYDHKRKESKEKHSEPKPPASDAADREKQKRRFKKQEENRARPEQGSSKAKVSSTFWTMCTHCTTYSEHVRAFYLDKKMLCPFCCRVFVPTEKFAEMVNGKPFIRCHGVTVYFILGISGLLSCSLFAGLWLNKFLSFVVRWLCVLDLEYF